MSGPARPTFPPARRGPGAGGGLGSGRRRGEGGDEAVRLTNDDAAGAKVSCVAAGYLRDGFVGSFVRSGRRARRPPLINRGYWSRVQALRQLLLAFLGDHPDGQVVVLGCGYDTTFFKLAAEGEARGRWWEVDFPQVAASKARVVTGDAKFTAHLGDEAGREATRPEFSHPTRIKCTDQRRRRTKEYTAHTCLISMRVRRASLAAGVAS